MNKPYDDCTNDIKCIYVIMPRHRNRFRGSPIRFGLSISAFSEKFSEFRENSANFSLWVKISLLFRVVISTRKYLKCALICILQKSTDRFDLWQVLGLWRELETGATEFWEISENSGKSTYRVKRAPEPNLYLWDATLDPRYGCCCCVCTFWHPVIRKNIRNSDKILRIPGNRLLEL